MPDVQAFLSHESACDVLRLLSAGRRGVEGLVRWPESARPLPRDGSCVSSQRDFRGGRVEARLVELGASRRPVELIVPRQEGRSSGRAARFHVWSGTLPARSLVQVCPGLLVSGPELVVIQLCSAQGKLDALLDAHVSAVHAEADLLADLGLDDSPVIDHPLEWERIRRLVAATMVACEFMGTYRLGGAAAPVTYRVRPLMSADSLVCAIAEVGEFQGTRRARRVCGLALEGSASPMETSLALMLTLPIDFGGFGLGHPQLNHALDVSEFRGTLSDRDVVTPDFLWQGEGMGSGVALEYDSDEFHAATGGARLGQDAVRANILASLGYCVLRATPETVRTLSGMTLLASQVAHALGVELAETTPLQDLRRRKLYVQLMPVRERS